MDQFPVSGYLPNPHDPRDVWEDELLAGEQPQLPSSFLTKNIPFEPQGIYPFCVAFASGKLLQENVKKVGGPQMFFSKVFQFFRSNGQRWGSTFRDNLNTIVDIGMILWSDLPMPEKIWALDDYDSLKQKADSLNPETTQKAPGYVRINPNPEDMKRAIFQYGAVLTGVSGSGAYWQDGSKREPGAQINHAVILVGWREDGCWAVHDSLEPHENFDGYHYIAPDYEFESVYALRPLPSNWRQIRDEARQAPPTNANYYGKKRDLKLEQSFASQMLVAFQRFNNQSVLDAAGRFWEMYIRAGVYGDYSMTDLVNDCYNWRRTNKHIFNFDQLRSEYKP